MPARMSSRAAGIGIPLAAAAILVTACGATTSAAGAAGTSTTVAPPSPAPVTTAQATTAQATTAPATPAAPAIALTTESGGYGVWLADRTGRTLYILTSDHGTTPGCYGACATTWPPLLTSGPVSASGAAVARDIGTTTRTDGRHQVTYAGHPLYYFARETGPDQVKGLGAQGVFFLLSPNGTVIKPPPPPVPVPRMAPPPMTQPMMAPPPMTQPMMGGSGG